jgi:pimeloyl-ACP methyl ester carboxylesterase
MNEDTITTGGSEPVRFQVACAGGVLAGWRWPNEGAPPLLFCHATGFCASAYKQMLQHLNGQFEVFALDMRGHGRTCLAAVPEGLRSWKTYADDVAEFLNHEARSGWTLAGHSMGGVVVAMAARGRDDVASIALIEPVAMPPAMRLIVRTPIWPFVARRFSLARLARRRRSQWPARADVAAAYGRKPVFRNWAPGVLDDYLEDGLADDDGGVRLACAPVWEAATFQAHDNDFWGAVRAAPAPIRVLAADHKSSTVWRHAHRRFERIGVSVARQAGVSHLIAMERPDLAAQFVAGE